MLYHLVFLSLTALASAIAPFNGFLRITNFEGRSVDLHIRSPADYAPIQSYMTTVGEPAQKVHLLRTLWYRRKRGTLLGLRASQSDHHLELPSEWRRIQHPGDDLGTVLTAWPFQPTLPLPTSPLTLETLNASLARQVFTLAAFLYAWSEIC
ncbi:hypothetical protein DFH08DRAFT_824596 [Mycena albidolilacea]|uniref:Uncharacterized protein n=1 Tax=Mycena albidolilacea TaxID=1033008 RepID=A0AAD6Z462_9AGAR|nr:hypothetical protein DFH08DRAFT_824596 [Mycena albidolilacea]